MPSWQGKSRGNTTGFRIFVWVLKHAGLHACLFVIAVCCFLLFFIFRKSISGTNMYFSGNASAFLPGAAFISIYKNYYWFGQTIIDRIVLMSGMKHPFRFEFEGEDYLREMVRQKKGGLLLSAHIGNWEIAGHLLNRLGTEMHIVMYDGEQQQIKDYLESITEKHSARIILIKNDLSHIYAIQEALNKNAFVCMHADRFLEGNKTITGRLLNKTAFSRRSVPACAQFPVTRLICICHERQCTRLSFLCQRPGNIFRTTNIQPWMKC